MRHFLIEITSVRSSTENLSLSPRELKWECQVVCGRALLSGTHGYVELNMVIISYCKCNVYNTQSAMTVDCLQRKGSGECLIIKMSSYQYRDPHVKDKTVSRPSYNPHVKDKTISRHLIFNMGIPIPGKDGLYIDVGPRSSSTIPLSYFSRNIPVSAPELCFFLLFFDFQFVEVIFPFREERP